MPLDLADLEQLRAEAIGLQLIATKPTNPEQIFVVIALAERNGGTVKITDARDAVQSLGLSRVTGNKLYNNLRHRLDESDRFEFIRDGTYRLL